MYPIQLTSSTIEVSVLPRSDVILQDPLPFADIPLSSEAKSDLWMGIIAFQKQTATKMYALGKITFLPQKKAELMCVVTNEALTEMNIHFQKHSFPQFHQDTSQAVSRIDIFSRIFFLGQERLPLVYHEYRTLLSEVAKMKVEVIFANHDDQFDYNKNILGNSIITQIFLECEKSCRYKVEVELNIQHGERRFRLEHLHII